MTTCQKFQSAARENGYERVGEFNSEAVMWFRKAIADKNTDVHKRMCIDGLTNSATVYWQSAAQNLNSKTFRTISSLQDWFRSAS